MKRVDRHTGVCTKCCLGVALDDVLGVENRPAGEHNLSYVFGPERETLLPSDDLCLKIGLSYSEVVRLSEMNDGSCAFEGNPHSFAQIAAHLRTLPVIEG